MKWIIHIIIFAVALVLLYSIENDPSANKGQKAVFNVIASAIASFVIGELLTLGNTSANAQQPTVTTEYQRETTENTSLEKKESLTSVETQSTENSDADETEMDDTTKDTIETEENSQEVGNEDNIGEKNTETNITSTENMESAVMETYTQPETIYVAETTRTIEWVEPSPAMSVDELNGVTGSLSEWNTMDSYRFSVNTDGIYGFNTDLSSGGSVSLRICAQNGEKLGEKTDQLNLKLTAGETYTLKIRMKKSCDYTLSVGIPTEETDVSGMNSFGGQMLYYGQEDRFWYTAGVSGTYRIETDCSSGGKVGIEVRGENEAVLKSSTDHLSVTLEENKKYLFVIRYKNACTYTAQLGVPTPVQDITDEMYVSGEITYVDQADRYQFTAEYEGQYEFSSTTDDGVTVQLAIEGENGSVLKEQRRRLSVELSEGKTYILRVRYASGLGGYEVDIE